MKRYFPVSIFFMLSGIILLSNSCKKQGELSDNDIRFDSIRITAVQYLFNDTTKPGCNLDLQFVFPVDYGKKKILDSIQSQFNRAFFGDDYAQLPPLQAAEKYKSDYLADYKNVEKEYTEDLKRSTEEETPPRAWYSYYLMGNVKIHFNKDKFLSYVIYTESYRGGAHGAHSYSYYTLNLENGQALKEKDIFSDDFQETLSSIIIDKIAKQNNVATEQDLLDIGYFGVTELVPNGNFMIDDKGISYLYNEYEIAPYVVGAIKVFIPYEELKSIINPESPVAELAGL